MGVWGDQRGTIPQSSPPQGDALFHLSDDHHVVHFFDVFMFPEQSGKMNADVLLRFELRTSESESEMLPLHYKTIWMFH
jgi:hypothetical protein